MAGGYPAVCTDPDVYVLLSLLQLDISPAMGNTSLTPFKSWLQQLATTTTLDCLQ